MKRVLCMLATVLLLCGCSKINDKNYDELINSVVASNYKIENTYRTGYKYYTPTNMDILSTLDYNETLADDNYKYYFYVDVVSYYNRVIEGYNEDTKAVYSKKINYEDKYGYIEINKWKNGKYLLEIMYNYAKIEVIVDKEATKETIAYAMSILSSITYQDTVLTSLMGEDVLKTNEVEHNIFAPADTESEYLEIVEEYGTYEDDSDKVDPDFIRR